MRVESCTPVIPSAELEKSLRLWIDGLGFSVSSEIRKDDTLIFCMLQKGDLLFMLNRRAGRKIGISRGAYARCTFWSQREAAALLTADAGIVYC